MRSSSQAALLICATLATGALAAQPTRFAVHPLLVIGEEPAGEEKLKWSLGEILTHAAVDTVPAEQVEAFLKEQPDRRCATNECLAKLARETGAAVLRVTIAPRAQHLGKPVVILTGKIVDANGVELDSMVRHYPRTKEVPGLAEAALERFIRRELALGNPDLEPLTAVEPPPPTIIRVEVPAKRPTWLIPTAAGAAAVAVVGAGLGTWLQLGAADKWSEVNEAEGTSVTSTRRAELLELRNEARAQQTQAVAAFAVGGGAALAAGILYFYAQTYPAEQAALRPVVSALPVPGGAFVQLGFALP